MSRRESIQETTQEIIPANEYDNKLQQIFYVIERYILDARVNSIASNNNIKRAIVLMKYLTNNVESYEQIVDHYIKMTLPETNKVHACLNQSTVLKDTLRTNLKAVMEGPFESSTKVNDNMLSGLYDFFENHPAYRGNDSAKECYGLTEDNRVGSICELNMWGMRLTPQSMPNVRDHANANVRAMADEIYYMIAKAKKIVDIVSLAPPENIFYDSIIEGLVANKNEALQVRFLFGFIPGGEDTCKEFRYRLCRSLTREGLGARYVNRIHVGRVHRQRSFEWNHAKIIACDENEAIVGGHNLWETSYGEYNPIHDLSLKLQGNAAKTAHQFTSFMWKISKKKCFYSQWTRSRTIKYNEGKQRYYFPDEGTFVMKHNKWNSGIGPSLDLEEMLDGFQDDTNDTIVSTPIKTISGSMLRTQSGRKILSRKRLRAELKGSADSARLLGVGRTPKSLLGEAASPSELAKHFVIMNAKRHLDLCQQDLVFDGSKRDRGHMIIKLIALALIKNRKLKVRIIVSPYNASGGGAQYSWGSGAAGTYNKLKQRINDYCLGNNKLYEQCIARLTVKDFHFASSGYKSWPGGERLTGTQAVFSTTVPLPKLYKPAPMVTDTPAPGNHSKFYMADNKVFYIGSDNMYPHDLLEFGFLSDSEKLLAHWKDHYFENAWKYSTDRT